MRLSKPSSSSLVSVLLLTAPLYKSSSPAQSQGKASCAATSYIAMSPHAPCPACERFEDSQAAYVEQYRDRVDCRSAA